MNVQKNLILAFTTALMAICISAHPLSQSTENTGKLLRPRNLGFFGGLNSFDFPLGQPFSAGLMAKGFVW
uniref:Secreted protein n=1 Tax=Phakopsora pachyrhizi TaxID=170000 RepID=A0A0S1MKC4_PHAPC